MRHRGSIWATATSAALFTIASLTLLFFLAAKIGTQHGSAALRALLLSASSLQLVSLGCLAYYCLFITRRSNAVTQLAWVDPGIGAGFNSVTLAAAGVALVWLVSHRPEGVKSHETGVVAAAFVAWTMSTSLQFTFFLLIFRHQRTIARCTSPHVKESAFGTFLSSSKELACGPRPSFCSRQTTLASRPATPLSRAFSLQSSTTKVASSFRSKFTRSSTQSSSDPPAFPAGEAIPAGSAFDRYDSSQVDLETRAVILSSSPTLCRPGSNLTPIPGSRPGSPVNEPQTLPMSPSLRQHSNSAVSNPFASVPSSPPSNFSRLSRPRVSPVRSTFSQRQDSSPNCEFIHPLFRPDSPTPPQILTKGTMVTASPLASQPITPRTLARLRSASDLRAPRDMREAVALKLSSTGHWQAMPIKNTVPPTPTAGTRPRSRSLSSIPPEMLKKLATAGDSQTASSGSIGGVKPNPSVNGSPGPSIIDEEEELPPILPGFVLSAGSRSSLVGYGKRKSVKQKNEYLL